MVEVIKVSRDKDYTHYVLNGIQGKTVFKNVRVCMSRFGIVSCNNVSISNMDIYTALAEEKSWKN